MILVAVFDEVYGVSHFIVSVLFFASIALFLVVYSLLFEKKTPLILLIISIVAWYLYFAYRIPSGAAIPELISIIIVIPYYLQLFLSRENIK